MPNHVVAYPEKLLETATRCAIYSLKFTKNRLAPGLRLGPHNRNMGPTWKGRGGRKKEKRGREGKTGGRKGSGKGGDGTAMPMPYRCRICVRLSSAAVS